MLPPDLRHIFKLKWTKFAARAHSAWSPRPPSWILGGGGSSKGKERKGREGEEEEGGRRRRREGQAFQLTFLATPLTCDFLRRENSYTGYFCLEELPNHNSTPILVCCAYETGRRTDRETGGAERVKCGLQNGLIIIYCHVYIQLVCWKTFTG